MDFRHCCVIVPDGIWNSAIVQRTLLSPNRKSAQEWILLKILQHDLLRVHDKFLQFLANFMTHKQKSYERTFKQFVHFEIFQMSVHCL